MKISSSGLLMSNINENVCNSPELMMMDKAQLDGVDSLTNTRETIDYSTNFMGNEDEYEDDQISSVLVLDKPNTHPLLFFEVGSFETRLGVWNPNEQLFELK